MKRYSTKQQEKLFRPQRIRVVTVQHGGYGYRSSHYDSYDIQVYNTYTGEVEARWCSHSCEDMIGHWDDEECEGCKRWRMGSKGRAIKVAKVEGDAV